MTQATEMVDDDVASATAERTAELWQQFGQRLKAFVASRVSDPDDVEDILQDVFARIHERTSTVRDTERITSWIYQVTRNAVVDHYRAAPRRREVASERLDDRVGDLSPEQWLENPDAVREELAHCLRPLLDRLPRRYREAIELTDLGGLTQTAAAQRLGLSTSGMKSRVQRARTQLSQTLHECCELTLDVRGGPVDFRPREDPSCC